MQEKILKKLTELELQGDKLLKEVKAVRSFAEELEQKALMFEKYCRERHEEQAEKIRLLAGTLLGEVLEEEETTEMYKETNEGSEETNENSTEI